MNTSTTHSLRLTRLIAADPEAVFRAWTEIEHMKKWSAPEGMEIPFIEADLRVGGRFRLTMRNADGRDFTAFGRYLAIEPPKSLSYSWDWEQEEHRMGETLITVEFNPVEGGTEVVMRHELLPTETFAADHTTGWTSCLNRLEALFSGAAGAENQ